VIPLEVIKRWSSYKIWNFVTHEIDSKLDIAMEEHNLEHLERLIEFRDYLWKIYKEKSKKGR